MSEAIGDYGMIGDLRTAALISARGRLAWLCWPDFDSQACFASLPVVHPISSRRLSIGPAIFYLFAAVAEISVLGIIITFMRVGHYPAYLRPVDVYPGTLSLIRDCWGISAGYDQRLGNY